jgi:predicted enzyme related to lactoylglutathione lyase
VTETPALGADGELGGWWVHFGTADCAQTTARVLELGGGVVEPGSEAGGSRMAAVADRQGAAFSLVESPVWPQPSSEPNR